jgi:hypothetical protein
LSPIVSSVLIIYGEDVTATRGRSASSS